MDWRVVFILQFMVDFKLSLCGFEAVWVLHGVQ